MKQNFLKWMVCMCFGLLSVATVMAGGNYKTVKVKAPFPMQPIKVFIYPDRDFKITDFVGQHVDYKTRYKHSQTHFWAGSYEDKRPELPSVCRTS